MNQKLLQDAKAAADRLHEDESVSHKETLCSLRELYSYVDTLIDALSCSLYATGEDK